MRTLISWTIRNAPAMNTLAFAILLIGGLSFGMMRRELFPVFQLEILVVSVPYPGASPEEVEEGICQRVEERVQSIEGIKKMTSIAGEGSGVVILELESSIRDVQKVLNEVRNQVDSIPNFPPGMAENKSVFQVTIREPVARIGVMGPEDDSPEARRRLREVTERIRDRMKLLPAVKDAELSGVAAYQIDVELSEETLRKYGLTLDEAARILQRQNIEVPGGMIRTRGQEILVRGKDKRKTGDEIAKIPLVTHESGVVLTVGDLGTVKDDFVDVTAISRIDGRPGLSILVTKTTGEDTLKIAGELKSFLQNDAAEFLPPGYEIELFSDYSQFVEDRLSLLVKNGWQGFLLVLLLLMFFLEFRLAFWVALGIPISMCGAGIFLYGGGETLNMLSMFAFIMVLGILVDDAIIVGENIYHHRQLGKSTIQAATDGTVEVIPSVISAVLTTVIAFVPLLFVPGIMGKFFKVVPTAVIAMLLVSLFESVFILPAHLGNHFRLGSMTGAVNTMPFSLKIAFGWPFLAVVKTLDFFLYPFRRLVGYSPKINRFADRILETFSERLYKPVLTFFLTYPLMLIAPFLGLITLFSAGFAAGWISYVMFPKSDAYQIQAVVAYPDGTGVELTEQSVRRIERTLDELAAEYVRRGIPSPIKNVQSVVGPVNSMGVAMPDDAADGSHRGRVLVELIDTDKRTVSSQQIIDQWREMSGVFPGADSVTFGDIEDGPGGRLIEFSFLAEPENMNAMEELVELTKAKLATYPGVSDISDNSLPGKWEYRIRVKDSARALGVTTNDLASAMRASYFGEEVMRLQRGRHEVKLMVRFPEEDRNSLKVFDDIRLRIGGVERPLTELAEITVERGYSQIRRTEQRRSVTIRTDLDTNSNTPGVILGDLKTNFLPPLLKQDKYAGIDVAWEGQAEQNAESIQGLMLGMFGALFAIFILLTLEFRSYIQPLIIMAIIPFSIIGAVVGHLVMGLEVTLLSLFGMVALIGVVINDSIVLIDYINAQIKERHGAGDALREILVHAGARRLRPVFLTSVTTIAGVAPLMMETSLQAQFMVPMAVSLSFGLMFSTVLVLALVPTLYLLYYRFLEASGLLDAVADDSE